MGTSPAQKDIERMHLEQVVESVSARAKRDGVHTLEAARRVIADGDALTDTQCNELAAGALSSLVTARHREETGSG